ncbi:MAG: M4 family metallopeptidase [Sporocytophaga sp.]|uniref:M4 family metallopeptidase n=1 Tax=Sporocytophaga sp. TaxID=2231183 RepID=UPI001B23DCB2|nr:M4 family metallopeptidase [Sporocytophaga sp.]MBO9703138.1 M4 family metallopeptidase [Sporocytophaga sp.]
MKVSVFFNFFLLGSLISYSTWAQKDPFNSKKHKDTLLNKSELKAAIIDGRIAPTSPLRTPAYENGRNSISLRTGVNNLRKDNNSEVVISKESGLPIFISKPANSNTAAIRSSSDIRSSCFDYLNSISSLTKISNPEQDFVIKSIQADGLGKKHVKLIQKYKGIKVNASEVVVHFNQSNVAEIFNGNYHLIKNEIDVKPVVDSKTAVNTVINDLSSKTLYKREFNDAEKRIVSHSTPEVDTVIYEDNGLVKRYVLAYKISICPNKLESWEYFVDAKSGNILKSLKITCHADGPRTATAIDLNGVNRTFNTYQEGSNYYLVDIARPMYNVANNTGAIITMDANNSFGDGFKVQNIVSSNNTWSSRAAVSAHYNAGIAYDYFRTAHNRNSIDGNEGTIYSVINVADEDGTALDNAYWNGKAMFYGNGNTAFKPLAGGLDVAGHEMTHGVVQNTANLKYEGESGAINESMADIFGSMMDSSDWQLGEDVVKLSVFPSGALRSLSDPHNGGSSLNDNGFQPRHMSEKYTGTQDNGGVHVNSGIPNWAFYKYATSLNSRRKAAAVFYRALSNYLTANSKFIDLRIAVIQSAKDLYGNSSGEAAQAAIAFDAVGITDGTGGDYTSTFPVNPGTEYLLSYDTDNFTTDGLFRSTAAGTNFKALLNKSVKSKPSVTDNGEAAVFVGTDQKIYTINVNPSSPLNRTLLQDQPIWSNVSISKNGERVAAITYDKDTSIYVYDFGKEEWATFKLYNPTYTGVKSKGPVYADAIEWSYDGESLVYDCFNSIPNADGTNIEYWDINIIKVWDNNTNDFADGEILKLFNNLSEGESIGNPSFSKNSPYILAFDYEYTDDVSSQYAVVGLDMEHNTLDLIAENTTLGFPAYNKNDNVVSFTAEDVNGNSNINYVNLNADKISSNGVQSKLIDNAMWPVYFAVGERSTSTGVMSADIETSQPLIYPNPTKGELTVIVPKAKQNKFEMQIFNQLGQLVKSKSFYNASDKVVIDAEDLPEGLYYLTIKDDSLPVSYKFIKQD